MREKPVHDPSYLDVLLTYGLDTRSRRIVLHGDIGHDDDHGKNPVTHVVRALLYLDRSAGPIELWINTDGGPSEEMFGLYDVIRTRRNQVHTIGFGLIASAGVLLLAAGDKRTVTENAWLMSHAEAADYRFDDTWTAAQRHAWQQRCERRWAELMGARTHPPRCRTVKRRVEFWYQLHQAKVRELWLDAREMIEWGIADAILTDVAPPSE